MTPAPSSDEIAATFCEGSWFGSLPDTLQAEILDRAVLQEYSAGQMIGAQGEPAAGFFGILDGQMAFEHWASEEESVLIHIGGEGMWFGELALLLDIPTLVSITAHTDLRFLLVSSADFADLLESDPAYYPYFAQLGLQRYALFLRLFAQVQGLSPLQRVRSRLADMVDLRRQEHDEGEVVELQLTQANVAALAGISRQTANELLHRLAEKGLIEYSFRSIRILDSAGLRGDLSSDGAGPGPWSRDGNSTDDANQV